VAEAKVAVGSVGARAVRAGDAERLLAGKGVDDAGAIDEAASLAAEAAQAVDDASGSTAYKEQLVRVLVKRCFVEATRPA
jgi:carbon-monoxide dehydrogenase medium subunit